MIEDGIAASSHDSFCRFQAMVGHNLAAIASVDISTATVLDVCNRIVREIHPTSPETMFVNANIAAAVTRLIRIRDELRVSPACITVIVNDFATENLLFESLLVAESAMVACHRCFKTNGSPVRIGGWQEIGVVHSFGQTLQCVACAGVLARRTLVIEYDAAFSTFTESSRD